MNKRTNHIRALAECAIMLALAFGLSYVKIFALPFGGSVTLLSMLPIILVSIRHGIMWGLGTAFCYSWLQVLQGEVFGWGLTPGMLVASIFLDYIIAFTVLGLAGVFRKKGVPGIIGGTVLVCVLRFLIHFIAGVVLWTNYEEFFAFGQSWVNRPVLYSLVYNGSFMLPEMIITVIGVCVLVLPKQVTGINKRKIWVCVIFSIITCGIYSIYWQYLLVKNVKVLTKDNSRCIKEMLCLLFIPFYSLYWWYTRGVVVRNAMTEKKSICLGSGIAYLLLNIHGLVIISMAILQNDFNALQVENSQPKNSRANKILLMSDF